MGQTVPEEMRLVMEIGGYFALEAFVRNEYYPEMLALNTARNALIFLCGAKHIRKLYLPYFLCPSVALRCMRENLQIRFYHVNADFTPDFSHIQDCPAPDMYFYIVNYYGQLSEAQICAYRAKYRNIILDNAQAFFAPPLAGIDTIYSCRKFFGVPDGAYLSTDVCADTSSLEFDTSASRMTHLLGRFEGAASNFYADFKANDASFAALPVRKMSKLTHNLLGAIDYTAAKSRRETNWHTLDALLGKVNPLVLSEPIGPYMYPFYCKNGIDVKRKLAERKVYIPTLWASKFMDSKCALETDYTENILPLPVDQRYTASEMESLASEVMTCIG